jgi:hypothetical protein
MLNNKQTFVPNIEAVFNKLIKKIKLHFKLNLKFNKVGIWRACKSFKRLPEKIKGVYKENKSCCIIDITGR